LRFTVGRRGVVVSGVRSGSIGVRGSVGVRSGGIGVRSGGVGVRSGGIGVRSGVGVRSGIRSGGNMSGVRIAVRGVGQRRHQLDFLLLSRSQGEQGQNDNVLSTFSK
jgi:hypothetical protein